MGGAARAGHSGSPVHDLRGKFTTDTDGRFWFWTVRMDGVVGRLLKVQGRHPYRSAHVHALIFRAGYKTLISGVFDPSDPSIDSDGQFGVTQAPTGDFVRHDEPNPE